MRLVTIMRNVCSVCVKCLAVMLVLVGVCNVGHAQVLYGALTGNVTDPSSAAIPGVKVTALNAATGITRVNDAESVNCTVR